MIEHSGKAVILNEMVKVGGSKEITSKQRFEGVRFKTSEELEQECSRQRGQLVQGTGRRHGLFTEPQRGECGYAGREGQERGGRV